MRDQSAVSPIIGTLLVFVIFTTATALVIGVGRPALIEYQEKGKFDTVVGQLGTVAGQMNQLAVSGEEYQVKQPRVAFPGGMLTGDEGHWVAVSVSYLSTDYGAVAGTAVDPGDIIRQFYEPLSPETQPADWHPVHQFTSYKQGAYSYTLEPFRFDGTQWIQTYNWIQITGLNEFEHGTGNLGGTLGEHPWRIDIRDGAVPGGPVVGHTYIFKTPRLTYMFDGHAGPKYVHIENGALFREENARFTQVGAGIVAAPNATLGNTAMTFRVVNFDPSALSVGGTSKVGVLMRNDGSEPFAYNTGAAWVNIQVWGEYPEVWYKHLEGQGFTREPQGSDFKGVSYAQTDATGKYVAFPFHFVYTDLFIRISNA